jgi:ribosomal protein S18 acetylase RimI-like enzyme
MLTMTFENDPPAGFRGELGQAINAFHAETVPFQSKRFGLRLLDPAGTMAAGLSGVMSWGWLFIDAVWVDPAYRGQGAGRRLLARAEAHALEQGCHAVWLDTFQARGFYEAAGYHVFGELENYPGTQTRVFLRKQLIVPDRECQTP